MIWMLIYFFYFVLSDSFLNILARYFTPPQIYYYWGVNNDTEIFTLLYFPTA